LLFPLRGTAADQISYVAFHSMQESHSSHDHDSSANGYVNPYALQQGSSGQPKVTSGEAAVVVLGMLLPLVTQIGHAHAH
jgi:solute carrier family 39 (zinc transporter), member 9